VTALAGRTAIVTGAGQGVGEGIARALATAGANVVVATRRAETGEPVAAAIRAAGGRASFVETDVTVGPSVDAVVARAVDEYGGLEIMVHNAYKPARAHRVEDADEDVWLPNAGTAVWGAFYCARAAYPHLRAAGDRGRLIFVSSPAGIEGTATRPVYAAVKGAQRALAKSLAKEWGADGITVNCIAPVAESPALAEAFAGDPDLRDAVAARTALRRIGRPEQDIGPVAVFLASDGASFVTGQTIVCDGGSFMGL
jgi:NAD(P)-dependent dehydrogenase (short-subunit alcohol dehydrogenase family)